MVKISEYALENKGYTFCFLDNDNCIRIDCFIDSENL